MIELIARKLVIEIALEGIKLGKLENFIKSEGFNDLESVVQTESKNQAKAMIDKILSLNARYKAMTKDFKEEQFDVITKGEEIIGNFNPSNVQAVDEIKLEAITLINTAQSHSKEPRRFAKGCTDIETGTMFFVKSLFH